MTEDKKPENPRMQNLDGMYAREARLEDYFSLRDYFAAKAMQASRSRDTNYISWKDLAKDSYEIADEMLKQREL